MVQLADLKRRWERQRRRSAHSPMRGIWLRENLLALMEYMHERGISRKDFLRWLRGPANTKFNGDEVVDG